MRKQLIDRTGRRRRSFTAIFVRFGRRHGGNCSSFEFALFTSVKNEDGKQVRDHLWIEIDERFRGLNLGVGDEVFLVAKVKKYRKRNPEHALDPEAPETIEDYTLAEVREIRVFSGPKIARQRPAADAPMGCL